MSQSLEFDELAGNGREGDKVGTITFKQRNTVIATMDPWHARTPTRPTSSRAWACGGTACSAASPRPGSGAFHHAHETPLVIDKTASAGVAPD
ncbi:MAG: hypothetical protein ACLSVD_08020 [Eggerthellaceae bacterium]